MINPETSTSGGLTVQASRLLAQYARDTIFVSRLFNRFLTGWDTHRLLRIVVAMVDAVEKEEHVSPNRYSEVCIIYRYFAFDQAYDEQPEMVRYKVLLDFLFNTLTESARELDWPLEVFHEAYSEVLSTNFINEYNLTSPQPSPDRTYYAVPMVRVARNLSTIFLKLKSVTGTTRAVEILKIAPSKDDFSIVSHMRWIDNSELLLSNADDEIYFRFILSRESIEIFFAPRMHPKSYLQDELILLNPDTTRDESIAILNQRIEAITQGRRR